MIEEIYLVNAFKQTVAEPNKTKVTTNDDDGGSDHNKRKRNSRVSFQPKTVAANIDSFNGDGQSSVSNQLAKDEGKQSLFCNLLSVIDSIKVEGRSRQPEREKRVKAIEQGFKSLARSCSRDV